VYEKAVCVRVHVARIDDRAGNSGHTGSIRGARVSQSYCANASRRRGIRAVSGGAIYRGSDGVSTLPPGLDQAPQFGVSIYRLRVLPADEVNGGYSIEATPAEFGPMRDDACGTFTLDATGQRGNRSAGSDSTPASGECWNTS